MTKRFPLQRWSLFPAIVASLFLLVAAAQPGMCADPVSIGIDGFAKVGLPTPVRVTMNTADVKTASFEAVDPQGNNVRYPLKPSSVKGESPGRLYQGRFRSGRIDGPLRLIYELNDGSTVVRRMKVGPDDTDDLKPLLRQSVLMVMTVGHPRGFGNLSSFGRKEGDDETADANKRAPTNVQLVELESAVQFPDHHHDLAAVNIIVLAGDYKLNLQQDRALRRWVTDGGHLIVSRGSRLEPFRRAALRRSAAAATGVVGEKATKVAGPGEGEDKTGNRDHLLAKWLPITVIDQQMVRELTEFETYVGGNSPILFNARVPAARILNPKDGPFAAGVSLANGSYGPMIVRVPFGMGVVTFCTIDLDRPPLSSWANIDLLGHRILEETLTEFQQNERSGRSRLSQTGVTDLGTQLHAIQEHFPEVYRISAWQTIGLLLLYIALLGPIDYVVVHRLLKRPRLTWVTLPILVTGATMLSIHNAGERNGKELQLNELQLVDIDATGDGADGKRTSQQLRHTTWATVYSPESRRFHFALQPMSPPRFGAAESPSLGWTGVNESVFGGMHRTGGLDMGRLTYTIQPEEMAIENLPISLWSSKSLKGSWRSQSDRLIDCRLYINDTGRLAGTLTHHLPASIEDWILVHGKQLYRAVPGEDATASIAAGQAFAIVDSGIYGGGLIAELKKTRLSSRPKYNKNSLEDNEQVEQIAYNVSEKNLPRFVRVMSFHEAIGGRKYTGLNGFSLRKYDLSRLLPLNRAILIGRIRHSFAKVNRHPLGDDPTSDDPGISPTRTDSFVRIVLPVRKRGSIIE